VLQAAVQAASKYYGLGSAGCSRGRALVASPNWHRAIEGTAQILDSARAGACCRSCTTSTRRWLSNSRRLPLASSRVVFQPIGLEGGLAEGYIHQGMLILSGDLDLCPSALRVA